jgi:hypothetical protein
MKTYPGIDYGFRPDSYWKENDPLQTALRNVKGENRRQMILEYAAENRLHEVEAQLLEDELDEPTRRLLGRIDPSFMGGEYLPKYLPGEVEIARICLQSTTSDVISLRATPTADRKIAYRVVDEYDSVFTLPIYSSDTPLTLAELIRQFDEGNLDDAAIKSGGLSLGYNVMSTSEGDRQEKRHFTRITSSIYQKLHEHYEKIFDQWASGSGV